MKPMRIGGTKAGHCGSTQGADVSDQRCIPRWPQRAPPPLGPFAFRPLNFGRQGHGLLNLPTELRGACYGRGCVYAEGMEVGLIFSVVGMSSHVCGDQGCCVAGKEPLMVPKNGFTAPKATDRFPAILNDMLGEEYQPSPSHCETNRLSRLKLEIR